MTTRAMRRTLKLVGQKRPHHLELDLTVDEFSCLSQYARRLGVTREEAIVFMLNAAADVLDAPAPEEKPA